MQPWACFPVFSMSRKNSVPYLGWPCNLICQVSTSSLHSQELLQSDALARSQSTEQQVEEPGERQGRARKTPLMPLHVRHWAGHFMATLNLQKDLKQLCFFFFSAFCIWRNWDIKKSSKFSKFTKENVSENFSLSPSDTKVFVFPPETFLRKWDQDSKDF